VGWSSTTSTSLVPGTSEAAGMVRTRDPWEIVLPNGALIIEIEADRPVVSSLKGVGINLVTLPSEALYLLQDGVIMEMRAHEQHTLQVISEQKVNNAQMVMQRDFTIDLMNAITDKNERMAKVVTEACRSILELDIPDAEPVDVWTYKLVARVHNA